MIYPGGRTITLMPVAPEFEDTCDYCGRFAWCKWVDPPTSLVYRVACPGCQHSRHLTLVPMKRLTEDDE